MIFEEVLKLIQDQDLVYGLGVLTGLFLYWFLRGILVVVSYLRKRKLGVEELVESEVPWWDQTKVTTMF